MHDIGFLAAAVVLVLGRVPPDQENPEYKQWSGFKKGSWVRYESENETTGIKTRMEMTVKLLEISLDKARLETIEVHGEITLPAQTKDVPAKTPEGKKDGRDKK